MSAWLLHGPESATRLSTMAFAILPSAPTSEVGSTRAPAEEGSRSGHQGILAESRTQVQSRVGLASSRVSAHTAPSNPRPRPADWQIRQGQTPSDVTAHTFVFPRHDLPNPAPLGRECRTNAKVDCRAHGVGLARNG